MFASAPNDAEFTGPTFVGSDTLFLAVQHPGELTASLDELTSNWPDGEGSVPRAGVVAIRGPFGN
jgi:secreted PhoX family phosphatase